MASSDAWQELRSLRASPTGGAGTDDGRRRVFAASLRQAEELAEAAAVSGYAAKPLPLFYSLSQAGRAIAAARSGDDWVLRGHGLSVRTSPTDPVLDTSIMPTQGAADSFSRVAGAIGSAPLSGQVVIGEVWAANPDLRWLPIPAEAGSWPRALEVPIGVQALLSPMGLSTHDAPDPDTQPITTGGMISAAVEVPGQTTEEVRDALSAYPTLRSGIPLKQGPNGAARAEAGDRVLRFQHQGSDRVNLAVEAPVETTMSDFWARQRAMASVVEVDESQPSYPSPALIGYALPQLAHGPAPSPLMLWWALLIGLSSLARYEPAAWTAAIDPDTSLLAVGLERVLDVAADRVPQRVLQALRAT